MVLTISEDYEEEYSRDPVSQSFPIGGTWQPTCICVNGKYPDGVDVCLAHQYWMALRFPWQYWPISSAVPDPTDFRS